ncbi:hypothetical protein P5661_22610 [Bacillus subtilis]|uniref:hypothetical protein n=1 Tax=Bacillus subtilis TaxID=1423 RepID=UPI003C722FBF
MSANLPNLFTKAHGRTTKIQPIIIRPLRRCASDELPYYRTRTQTVAVALWD